MPAVVRQCTLRTITPRIRRAVMAKTKLKCPKCDRTFGMAAHLARHVSAGHGKKKTVKKKVAKKRAGAKRAKKVRRRKVKAVGRPKGAASRLGLRNMSLEQLAELIAAARGEARRKLAELQKAMK